MFPTAVAVLVLYAAAYSFAQDAYPPPAGDFPSGSTLHITGGDWRWEYYDDQHLKGEGAGNIVISWGEDITAAASYARISSPPHRIELSGGAEIDWLDRKLTCVSFSYDEDKGLASAEGDVVAVYTDPPVRIESDSASFFGGLKDRGDALADGTPAKVSFRGNVTVFAPQNVIIESDEISYFPDLNVLTVPGSYTGSLPLQFVNDPDNPFYGQNARFAGIGFDALVTREGILTDAASQEVEITTENAFISAPLFSAESDARGARAILESNESARVGGYFITPNGQRANFTCNRLEISREKGRIQMSGNVMIDGEGIHFLSGLVNLEFEDDSFRIASERRTEINLDDLYFFSSE